MSTPTPQHARAPARSTDTSLVSRTGSLRRHLAVDAVRAAVAALLGCALFAAIDYAATLWAAPSGVAVATAARLALLELTLAALLFLVAAPLLVLTSLALRLGMAAVAGQRARTWPGLFSPSPPHRDPSAAAPWLWSLLLSAGAYLGLSTLITLKVATLFKEPQLTALVLAALQLALFALLAGLALALARLFAWLGRRLHPRLGRVSPFGSVPAALALMVLLGVPAARLLILAMPQIEPLIPWRHIVGALAFGVGAWSTRLLYASRGRLLPEDGRRRLIVVAAALFAGSLIAPLTLVKLGADPDTKALAVSSSPPMNSLIGGVRRATDFDGDSFGWLLGENDCDPFDGAINPLARDIPDNGIDENCDGADFVLGALPSYRTGERMPVPEAYQRDYNFLLITVDTLRYDHTGFGGYGEKTGRDTTPRLDALVERAVSFAFANAPSAGTMASIPAILTSKFFHSGIALDEDVPRGKPPKLRPENTLLSEIVKQKGYTTGAILSHYYFNDWGMEQGFDVYDNSIGAKNQPFAVTSDKLTDRAIAWIGKRTGQKWFLWIHYIDPHGRYVSHPGEPSFGTTEEDLYDGEIRFTDKHLGRLLDYVARSDGGDRTAIFLTSDHGDGFREHGYINHGADLHREILHIPLIAYIPNLAPRVVEGAVSPIDIFPTIADLVGADISEFAVEGESLVPQLFYGKDAHHRVVFAETNYKNHLRAAVTSSYKLIRDLHSDVYRLYDLKKDPWEQKNARSEQPEAFEEMKGYLSEWLERVYYTRDPASNQAMAKLQDYLVREPPRAATPVAGVSFDDGRIEVLGLETDQERYAPGEDVKLALYFRATTRPSGDFKLQVESWPADEPSATPRATSKLRLTAKGLLPTSRWRDGEHIRDRFRIRVPRSWFRGDVRRLRIGLRMTDAASGEPLSPTGPTRPGDPLLADLGVVELEAGAEPPTPAKAPKGKTGRRGRLQLEGAERQVARPSR